jgi:hypothetical protein
MTAHIAGVPVEEFLPWLVSGIGAGLLLKLTSIWSRVQRWQNRRGRPWNAPGS